MHAAAGALADGMTTDDPPDTSLQDLEDRLKHLRQEQQSQERYRAVGQPATGLGTAWLIAAHLVTGLAVGGGLGYLLDVWLGTKPVLMIVFFVLGGAAGMRNVYRTAQGMAKTIATNASPPHAEAKGPSRSGSDRKELG